MVIDAIASFGMDGRVAQETLDRVLLTTNKQVIPDDPNPPMRPSGLRLGTPAATSRGMGPGEMPEIAAIIVAALRAMDDPETERELAKRTKALTARFPVPEL